MRFNELRETLQLRLSGEFKRFADEELRAVLTLLAGPGRGVKAGHLTLDPSPHPMRRGRIGSWVLLQPERINAYAQAVIRTSQALSLLAGPGMIQRLDIGGFILLRSDMLSRYAAAVVRKVREHPRDLFSPPQPSPALRAPSPTPVGEGLAASARTNCWPGDLDYQDFKRLPREEEAVVLRWNSKARLGERQ